MSRQPIRARLALLYAGSLLGLFVVIGLVLREAVRVGLDEDFETSMARNAELFRGFFRLEVEEYGSVEATVGHISSEMVIPDRVVRFHTPAGGVFESPTQAADPSPPLRPPVRIRISDLDPELAPGWQVEIQASEADLRALFKRIDTWFFLGTLLGVVLAAVAGWWVTGRTLRPVAQMAGAAEGITPEGGGRLPVANPHDELGRLGLRFNAVLDRLDRALEQQRAFLADAAHELRTPVARMRADVEVALLPEVDAEQRTGTLERMAVDLKRTGETLDELLQLARADADPSLELELGFLDDVVHDVQAAWRRSAERGGICLALETLEEAPVMMNAEAVRRLAAILIDNALRYTPEGGRVAVRVTRSDGVASFEVEDSGIGIPEADRPMVGRRFFRGAQARALVAHGSGLGLPIAQWIVDQHGGSMTFEHPPAGTRVRVELPAVQASPESPETI